MDTNQCHMLSCHVYGLFKYKNFLTTAHPQVPPQGFCVWGYGSLRKKKHRSCLNHICIHLLKLETNVMEVYDRFYDCRPIITKQWYNSYQWLISTQIFVSLQRSQLRWSGIVHSSNVTRRIYYLIMLYILILLVFIDLM